MNLFEKSLFSSQMNKNVVLYAIYIIWQAEG